MLQQIWAVVACILSFAMCVLVVYFLISGRHDRDKEKRRASTSTRTVTGPTRPDEVPPARIELALRP